MILFSGVAKDNNGSLYSGLPVGLAYSAASILVLLIFLHLTVYSKFGNSLIALSATLIIPVLGTIFLSRDFIAGLMAGFIGIVAFTRYWIPMAALNIFLFIRYENTDRFPL